MELCRNLIITENKMIVNTKKKAPILGPFCYFKTKGTAQQKTKRNEAKTKAEEMPERRIRNL